MSQELIINNSGVIARAELDTQISTAKAYPRNVKQSLIEAETLATMDEETAQSCFYALARKSKDGERSDIKGPSIRLAEIIASSWGNLHAATRIIGNDGKMITAEAVAWDLEKNVRISTEVKRSISGKYGTYTADMQVVTGNAACSIALRNAIIKVIPRSFIDSIYKKAVIAAVGDQKALLNRIKNGIEKFKSLGIEQDKILKFFQKSTINDLTSEDLEILLGTFTAIKENTLKIDEAFSDKPESNNNVKTDDTLKDWINSKSEGSK